MAIGWRDLSSWWYRLTLTDDNSLYLTCGAKNIRLMYYDARLGIWILTPISGIVEKYMKVWADQHSMSGYASGTVLIPPLTEMPDGEMYLEVCNESYLDSEVFGSLKSSPDETANPFYLLSSHDNDCCLLMRDSKGKLHMLFLFDEDGMYRATGIAFDGKDIAMLEEYGDYTGIFPLRYHGADRTCKYPFGNEDTGFGVDPGDEDDDDDDDDDDEWEDGDLVDVETEVDRLKAERVKIVGEITQKIRTGEITSEEQVVQELRDWLED